MLNNPLLSIITVSYNNLSGLKKTLESVFYQTYQDFELIVIDGESNDGSKGFLKKNIKRIDKLLIEPDSGVYNAMNKGLTLAKGEYVLFLNSGDDFLNPGVLEKNLAELETEDIICFDINVIGERDSFVKKSPSVLNFSFLYHDTLPHQATFIKRKLFDEIGDYDESLKIVADWKFFCLALVKFNASYKKVDRVLSNYYLDGISSLRENRKWVIRERKQVLESEFEIISRDIDDLSEKTKLIENLRRSRKIDFLVRLGVINKF